MLSFDMERYQFNKTIQEIKSLCTTSECDHAFLTDLQEQWEREDKNRRTIQGIEYETREEASEAGVELKKIEKLYEGYKKSYTQKYLSLMKCSFKTKSAKQKIQQKEKELIEHVADLEKKKNFNALDDTASSMETIIGAVEITVVILILNGIFSSGLLKAICLMVVIGTWGFCAKEISDSIKSGKKYAESCQKELAEFNSVFKIVDNHVVLKENEK